MRRNELLLIQRAGEPYAGQWALVGGKWDFGETLAEAVVREVQEETGLITQFVALRGVISERVAPAEPGALAAHFLLLLCDLLVHGRVKRPNSPRAPLAGFARPKSKSSMRTGRSFPVITL